jgi:FkbM family methyltransferase
MQIGNLKLKHCRYGWMLFSGPYIGTCFDLYGQYSESEVSMMRTLLQAGDCVIDVGANIGDLTIPLARIVGDAGSVYAIESHPRTFNILCANLALNAIGNTKPINAFVAPEGSTDTGGPWGEYGYVDKRWPTPFVMLDDLDLPRCDLIKIDVDGKELEILRSAEMQIERFRPFLYFENDVRERSAELISFAMSNLGYDLYWHPAPIFDPNNYFGNPVNHWAPNNIVSVMVVGVPAERDIRIPDLRRVASENDWWN